MCPRHIWFCSDVSFFALFFSHVKEPSNRTHRVAKPPESGVSPNTIKYAENHIRRPGYGARECSKAVSRAGRIFVDCCSLTFIPPTLPFHSQVWSISNFPCSLTRLICTSHSIWRTWLFTAYSDVKDDYTINSHYLTVHFSLKGGENVLLELGSERIKLWTLNSSNTDAPSILKFKLKE